MAFMATSQTNYILGKCGYTAITVIMVHCIRAAGCAVSLMAVLEDNGELGLESIFKCQTHFLAFDDDYVHTSDHFPHHPFSVLHSCFIHNVKNATVRVVDVNDHQRHFM